MNFPSFEKIEMRPTVPGGAVGFWPLCPSEIRMSPFGARMTSHGSFSDSGGSPGAPPFPIVIRILPSGLNLITRLPLPAASGNFAISSGVAARSSVTQTLPSLST